MILILKGEQLNLKQLESENRMTKHNVWVITKFDGTEKAAVWEVPRHYSQKEVEQIMQRMVCTDLSPSEVLNASRRKGYPLRAAFLDRVGRDPAPQFGPGPWCIARIDVREYSVRTGNLSRSQANSNRP